MKVEVEVPLYTASDGLRLDWDHGFQLGVRMVGGEVTITGNPAGLRSLARHLLMLAQDGVPIHRHIHLDDTNALDDGSSALIVERM